MKSKKLHGYITWALQIILGLLFLAAGAGKFLAAETWIQKFTTWGFFNNFYLLIGVVELLGAILLFLPKLSKYAAMLLVVVMTGAVITHIVHQEAVELFRPVIFMALLSALIFLKKNDLA